MKRVAKWVIVVGVLCAFAYGMTRLTNSVLDQLRVERVADGSVEYLESYDPITDQNSSLMQLVSETVRFSWHCEQGQMVAHIWDMKETSPDSTLTVVYRIDRDKPDSVSIPPVVWYVTPVDTVVGNPFNDLVRPSVDSLETFYRRRASIPESVTERMKRATKIVVRVKGPQYYNETSTFNLSRFNDASRKMNDCKPNGGR